VIALADAGAPLCVDLADILFDDDADPLNYFRAPDAGGLLLTFPSSNPVYSYAELDSDGAVLRTAEKKVISSHASAGVYFFRDAATFLRSVAHSLENREALAHNNLLFVCPLFNGVLANGAKVGVAQVRNIRDVKVST
jgi:dTDP-glucose pyrophosphorylase